MTNHRRHSDHLDWLLFPLLTAQPPLAAVDTSAVGVSLFAVYFLHSPPIAPSLLDVLPLAVFAPLASTDTSAVRVLLLFFISFACWGYLSRGSVADCSECERSKRSY